MVDMVNRGLRVSAVPGFYRHWRLKRKEKDSYLLVFCFLILHNKVKYVNFEA